MPNRFLPHDSDLERFVARAESGLVVGGSPRLSRPLLYLPPGISARPVQEALPLFLVLRLGAGRLLGLTSSWDEVQERLSRYSLPQILGVLGDMSARLQKDPSGAAIQAELVERLFGQQGANVLLTMHRCAEESRREGFGDTIVAFEELLLANAAKVALLTVPSDIGGGDAPDLRGIGEALLMISDLLEQAPGSLSSLDIETEEGWERALQHMLVNSLFHRSQYDLHVLARCYDIFLTDKADLRSNGDYVDLPNLTRTATGFEPEVFWAVLFAFFASLEGGVSGSSRYASTFERSTYFTSHFGFTSQESEAFFGLLAIDAATLAARVGEIYSLQDLKPFHFLPLAQSPLIGLGDTAFCPSRTLLFDAATHGIYHRLLNAGESPSDRSRFQAYVGVVFEDYIHRLLSRVFGVSEMLGRYIDSSALLRALRGNRRRTPKVCDGIIIYRDAIVLLEAKAKMFSLSARTGGSFEDYERKLREIFVGSAGQIQATIDAVEAGRLRHLGVDPSQLRYYYPLVVSLELIPLRGGIYRHVDGMIRAEGYLVEPAGKVQPIQLLTVDELELIEPGLNDGLELCSLLQRKIADGRLRSETFTNFAHHVGEQRLLTMKNEYLATLFRRLGEQSMEFFRARMVEPSL